MLALENFLTQNERIKLNTAVDTHVIVWGTWNRNGTDLVNRTNSGRITVSNPQMEQPPYQTTVRFSPLNNITDPGTYECTATVTPQNDTFITGTTSSISRTITVAGTVLTMCSIVTNSKISLLQVSPHRKLTPSLMKGSQQLDSLATH